MATFGSLLRQHRKACNLSQAALAEASEISVAAVAAYERGIRSAPHPETLRRISDSLGLSETARLEFEQAGRRKRRPLVAAPARVSVADAQDLPFESTTFVGRERELDDLVERLQHYRLVTITGAGGIGKTRLALRAARESLSAFSLAPCFVDLSAIDGEETLYRRVSSALGITVSSSAAEFTAVVSMLAERSALLVLDNCEHLTHAVGLLVKPILARAPGMRVLLTSRRRTAVQGEGIFRLAPLPVPFGVPASVEEARQYAAVELFLERAHSADQTFILSKGQIAAVVDICRRLDGMPLALELAAAKVPVCGIGGLQLQLRKRLADLRTSATDLPPRQRSLRAMIEWSCSLIDDAERRVFYRLSTFTGVFCIEDAEHVCSDDTDSPAVVVDAVESLVEHSLIACDYQNEPPLYRMLEPLREFGREMLGEAERVRLSDRHARWYSTLADEIDRTVMTLGMQEWSARLTPRTNDVLRAIDWALSRNELALAGNIIGGARGLWVRTLRGSEGMTLADRVLKRIDRTAHPAITAKLLLSLVSGGPNAISFDLLLEAIRLREALGDTRGLVPCYLHLANKYCLSGEFDDAGLAIESALSAARAIGFEEAYPAISSLKAFLLVSRRRFAEAREVLEQSLAQCDASNDSWGNLMNLLAQVNAHLGATREAAESALAAHAALRTATAVDVVNTVVEAVAFLVLDRDTRWSRYADEMLVLATKQGFNPLFVGGLLSIAYALAVDGAIHEAAIMSGFVERWIDEHESVWLSDSEIAVRYRLRRALAESLGSAMTSDERTRYAREGALSTFDSIVARAREDIARVAGSS